MTYKNECRYGRNVAAGAVAEYVMTGNQPKLVRMIRDMAGQDTGIAIGFLHAIAERVAK